MVPTASAILDDGTIVEMVYRPDQRRTLLAIYSMARWTVRELGRQEQRHTQIAAASRRRSRCGHLQSRNGASHPRRPRQDQDLGATAKDSAGHDLGVKTFPNGALVADIVLDTSTTTTATIDYVVTYAWGNTATATRAVIIDATASTTAQ